ncbi:glutathione S-transferase family protein [Sphingomonas sp. AOB5]|uniref:glutathione S-transferase family protein n=1 Tax=Sphingomonas sp. AOB5 TaxID=3034017 RepID=UPI0023F70DB0|nr:glutathione S-transferase family protein [Sphingomonas sp. AOB5]MDF7776398.1 glutathione S-transferase family protein [Sphingomonas sp. AOB5]
MAAPAITLYFAPGSCSRVPMLALEEAGVPYERHLVKFMAGEHRAPDYLAINPKGKVPAITVDGTPVTENAAIQWTLARLLPEADLLPITGDPMADAPILSDLLWCASGMHPIITRMRLPQFFVGDASDAKAQVSEIARQAMLPNFALIEQRLSAQPWMLGDRWSTLDAYIYWIWFRVGDALDRSPYPAFADHHARINERPATQRMLEHEAEALAWLEANGLVVPAAPPASHGPGGSFR